MSAESSCPGGRAVQPTKRKHSIKQFVFSYSHNETETSGRAMRNPIGSHRRQKKSNNSGKPWKEMLRHVVVPDSIYFLPSAVDFDVAALSVWCVVVDSAFLNRYGGLDHVVEDEHSDRICFIHNHKIVRAAKVYINIYHLWKRWLNRKHSDVCETAFVKRCACLGALRSVGLGGGYHTAIEISGTEYHFGGCPDVDSGIFESQPLHRIKSSQEPVESLTLSEPF